MRGQSAPSKDLRWNNIYYANQEGFQSHPNNIGFDVTIAGKTYNRFSSAHPVQSCSPIQSTTSAGKHPMSIAVRNHRQRANHCTVVCARSHKQARLSAKQHEEQHLVHQVGHYPQRDSNEYGTTAKGIICNVHRLKQQHNPVSLSVLWRPRTAQARRCRMRHH